jgi:hypothetical protein
MTEKDRAIVVFHDHGNHCLDPLLKQGFRHVFCAVDDGVSWVQIDGRTGIPLIEAVCASDFDLARHYRAQGFTVVETHKGSGLRLPLVLSNCVGLVKAALGLHLPFTVTPYQLYKRLALGDLIDD